MKTDQDFATPQPARAPLTQTEEASAADWEAMGNSLRELHRALLVVVRRNYERDHGPIANPGHFLQLLTGDEYFAWLRPLSRLMADIDHIRGMDADSRRAVARSVRVAVEGLLGSGGAESAEVFLANYLPLLARETDVVMAHARLRQAVRRWPAPDQFDAAGKSGHRQRVAEMAQRRAAIAI